MKTRRIVVVLETIENHGPVDLQDYATSIECILRAADEGPEDPWSYAGLVVYESAADAALAEEAFEEAEEELAARQHGGEIEVPAAVVAPEPPIVCPSPSSLLPSASWARLKSGQWGVRGRAEHVVPGCVVLVRSKTTGAETLVEVGNIEHSANGWALAAVASKADAPVFDAVK